MTPTPSPIDVTRRHIRVCSSTPLVAGESKQSYQFADQRIVQDFQDAATKSETIDLLLANLARIVSDQSECLSLWACQRNENGEFGSAHLLSEQDGDALWTVVEDHAREMIDRVAGTRQICSSPIRSESKTELVVAPICTKTETQSTTSVQLVLIGCFSSEKESVLRLQWLLGLATQAIARWHLQRNLKHQESQIQSLGDTLGLINSLDQTASMQEASLVITNHLRRLCQAEQVAISFCESPGKARLNAISDVEQIDLNCESNKLVSTANEQALIAEQELCYPAANEAHSPHLLALEKYCKANGFESCINLPLTTFDKRTIGTVLIACRSEKINDENYRQYVAQLINVASGHLDVVFRANRRTRDVFRDSWKKLCSANLTKAILIGLGCLAALMLIPLPYRVSCDCEVQPVLRRFVAAPYQGILEKTLVESGDVIESDQMVAHLDGRQLRMELSGLRAEFAGARKRRDSALAQGDVALSQIASSEMKRHSSRIEILEQNLTNLEVRSPISGIVISGDLEKVEGAPVEMGQTLFEIAPLDQMLAEIGIPESEIRYVKPGMQVDIKLNAFPFKTWSGIVEQIHPGSEIIDDESVFVAQVKLANEENQLRPGMRGSAKIKTKSAPIGWNLFHQSWESIRYWMVW